MSELTDNARLVMRSLEERPTLNTPTLIAGGDVAGEVEQAEIERALDELIEAGHVVHRPTGWKLKPQTV